MDRWAFREVIKNPHMTAGFISKLLADTGYPGVDRAAVGHFRRKLLIGKAKL